MSRYDLIAFDMDGTLLNSNKKISADSLEAIEKALQAGKVVTLSTGRPVAELREYEEQLKNLPYYICNSGALVLDRRTNEHIFENTLSESEILSIFEATKGIDVMLHNLSEESYIQQNQFDRIEDFKMEIYRPLYGNYATMVEDMEKFYKENRPPLYKFNLYSKNEKDRAFLKAKLSSLDIAISYAERTSLECVPKNVSKGTALKALCQHLNIPIERSIAVGDADNDLEIIKTAGLGVAMGNANDNVKAIADITVRDCDNGGCAQAIYDYLLK